MGNSLCLFPLISSQGFVIHKGVLGYWDSACKWYSADVPSVGNLGSALGLRTPRFPAWPPSDRGWSRQKSVVMFIYE